MAFDPRDYLLQKAVVSNDVYDVLVSDTSLTDRQKFQLLQAIGTPALGRLSWMPDIVPHRMIMIEILSGINLNVEMRGVWWFDDLGHLQTWLQT